MASVFGIASLRSRFDDWRLSFRRVDPDEPVPDRHDPPHLTVVGEPIDLSALIERLVIPRLVAEEQDRGHQERGGGNGTPLAAGPGFPVSEQDVSAFADLAINGEAATLIDFIDTCLMRGSSVEHIYVDLLAPAARRLGSMWEDDQRDFIDVTMGLWRIQEVLRELNRRAPPTQPHGNGVRTALFSTMPGDQHSFGTLMVCECFERAGWSAEPMIDPTTSELLGKLAGRHYDLVGLTVSTACPRAKISSLISSIRSVSSNPGVCVMVGGPQINAQSELAAECGADATAVDAIQALETANALVSAMALAPSALA